MQNVTQHMNSWPQYTLPLSAALSNSLSPALSESVFLCLSLSIHHQIWGISPKSCSSYWGQIGKMFRPSCPQNSTSKYFSERSTTAQNSSARFHPDHTWNTAFPWIGVHLKADSLTLPLMVMTFDLSADHEILSSQPLLQELQETGSCDPVVYAATERPITVVTWQVSRETGGTMWVLFSNKFQLPWGSRDIQDVDIRNVWKCEFRFQDKH